MKFDIITIFPEIFSCYFSHSIIGKSVTAKKVSIKIHNLRDFTIDKRRTVDDTPYGGGSGMILKIEPIYKAVNSIISNSQIPISKGTAKSESQKPKTRIILFSAKGKKYTQKDVRRLAKFDNLILICGRYEGVDERVAEYIADEEISIGDYVLTGGEIPAMILVDTVSRLLPGVLGNPMSLEEESFGKYDREYPQYTKPEKFKTWKVPKILLSGNHSKIKEWREKKSNSFAK